MLRRMILVAALSGACLLTGPVHTGSGFIGAAQAAPGALEVAQLRPDRVYRNCRRQVRRALGAIRGVRFRAPKTYPFLIDRCVASGGVYS